MSGRTHETRWPSDQASCQWRAEPLARSSEAQPTRPVTNMKAGTAACTQKGNSSARRSQGLQA